VPRHPASEGPAPEGPAPGGSTAGWSSARVVPLRPGMRVLLVVAGVLVLLAGVQLYLGPTRTDTWFAWTIGAPMTAVFLGASYWAAAVIEWVAASRRSWADARIAVPGVFVFTTLTLVVTLVHLGAFHLGPENAPATRAVTWAWITVYAAVPVLMATLWWRQARVTGPDPPRTAPLSALLRGTLVAQAAVLLPAGTWLLLAPTSAATWWPWPLTPLTGRAIGAWLVSLGVVAAHGLVERDAVRFRPAAAGSVAFLVLQVVALARFGDALRGGASTVGYLVVLGTFAITGVAPWHRAGRVR
jgi:hypothetical protein